MNTSCLATPCRFVHSLPAATAAVLTMPSVSVLELFAAEAEREAVTRSVSCVGLGLVTSIGGEEGLETRGFADGGARTLVRFGRGIL